MCFPVQEERSLPWLLRVRVSDAVIVVYSITDRASFHLARESLDKMTTWAPSINIPVLLLANKADLQHLRKVYARIRLAVNGPKDALEGRMSMW